MNDDARGPDWRWFAGGSLAIVGSLVGVVLWLHTSMESLYNANQDTRISAVEADVRGIRDMAAKIPVMDVKITVANDKLDRLEAAVSKMNDRLETRAAAAALLAAPVQSVGSKK